MNEIALFVLQVVVGLATTVICVAGVPFAMKVVSQLSAIRTTLEGMGWMDDAIGKLREEVQDLKERLAGCRNCQDGRGVDGA